MSRWIQLGLAALLASACSGDEPAPEPRPGAGQVAAEQEGPPTGAQWWSSARSLNEAQPEDGADAEDPRAVISCRLGSGTRFMRRGDCLVQGGRPQGS